MCQKETNKIKSIRRRGSCREDRRVEDHRRRTSKDVVKIEMDRLLFNELQGNESSLHDGYREERSGLLRMEYCSMPWMLVRQ